MRVELDLNRLLPKVTHLIYRLVYKSVVPPWRRDRVSTHRPQQPYVGKMLLPGTARTHEEIALELLKGA